MEGVVKERKIVTVVLRNGTVVPVEVYRKIRYGRIISNWQGSPEQRRPDPFPSLAALYVARILQWEVAEVYETEEDSRLAQLKEHLLDLLTVEQMEEIEKRFPTR